MEKTETLKLKGLKVSIECEEFQIELNEHKIKRLMNRMDSLECEREENKISMKKIFDLLNRIEKAQTEK